MQQYKIGAYFRKGYLILPQIKLVTEDYKSTEFIFEFDVDEGRKVFELKKPDGSKYIKDIIDNKITLVDYDAELNEISLIPTVGIYEFEIVNYTEDSKLTLQEHGHFEVRGEIVEVNDSEVEKDTRLPILDSLINDVEGLKTDINSSVKNATEQAEYAKQQGDYAKEQAQIIIDANTTATKIINDFETNADEYTKDFNTNADEKLEAYNQNDIDKTNAYNENAESKENSYNENASTNLKEYNDNATTKLLEYNINSETKTKAFNTNASEKTDAFNLNAINKTDDFNNNVEAKITEFNDNATTKTEEYNTNAEAKVNEFNTNVDELKQDVEDCYNNMLTNEVEGQFIYTEDSAAAKIRNLEIEGNCYQETIPNPDSLSKIETIENQINIEIINKNFLTFKASTQQLNGLSVEIKDETIICNGVTTATWANITDWTEKNILAGTYTFSLKETLKNCAVAMVFKYEDDTLVECHIGVGNTSKPITLTQNIKSYRMYVFNMTVATEISEIIYPMLEKGTTATANELHKENILYIDLQENFGGKVGNNIADKIRVENGRAVLTKKIGKKIFDGSDDESWSIFGTSCYRILVDNLKINESSVVNYNNILSNYFECCTQTEAQTNLVDYGISGRSGGISGLSVQNKDITNIADFKSWLSEHNLEVYYELEEPYEVDLGIINMPKTFEGITNVSMISNVNGNMKLKYIRSTNIVVDNLAKAIVAMGGEV